MNKHIDITSMNNVRNSAGTAQAPEGYILLLNTTNIFSMDLVGKNLKMNGIDAMWSFPDPVEFPEGDSALFVKAEQKDQALDVLTSLDLIDFTKTHGQ